jgi:protein ImuB
MSMVRMLVAWFPDWPVVAAGCDPATPAAVVRANRVVSATRAAYAEGVRLGIRRREAQGHCPELQVIPADAARDARAWEPAVVALETLTSAVEVLGPGAAALATRGPSRYFGGDEALAVLVAETVNRAVGQLGCRVGVADGRFTAGLAARAARARGDPVVVVPPGSGRTWLAPQPVQALGLEYEALSDLLVRLGIRTLGDLAALPGPSVLGRFGSEGARAQCLARGRDERSLAARIPPPDLAVTAELDPPAERVDTAAFVAKALADELHQRLAALGLSCTMVAIEAETEHGELLVRRWRHEGALTAAALSERARWQLEGWLAAPGYANRPTGGLTLLRLKPEEVCPDNGRQQGFWGDTIAADSRAARALARVQGMLGPEAVVTAVPAGGRSPSEQVRLVPWGSDVEARPPPRRRSRRSTQEQAGAREGQGASEIPPWPGRLSRPAPAVVYSSPRPAEVCDSDDHQLSVSGRGLISAAPAWLAVEGGPPMPVTGWAGPWPVEERWWDAGGRRKAWIQVLLADGTAHLVTREAGQWWVEATYG